MSRLVDALKTALAANFQLRDMTSAEETSANWQRDGFDIATKQIVIVHVLLPSDDTVIDAVMASSCLDNYHSSDAYPAPGNLLFAWDVELRFRIVPTPDALETIATEATSIADALGGRFDGWSLVETGPEASIAHNADTAAA